MENLTVQVEKLQQENSQKDKQIQNLANKNSQQDAQVESLKDKLKKIETYLNGKSKQTRPPGHDQKFWSQLICYLTIIFISR